MWIIWDVNSFSNFRNTTDEDMEPVRNWLESENGKIVYSSTEKFRSEWEAGGGVRVDDKTAISRRKSILLH